METQASFACDQCGKIAGTVRLVPRGHPDALRSPESSGTIIISGFIGVHKEVVASDDYQAVQWALCLGSVSQLHNVRTLWAPYLLSRLQHMSLPGALGDGPDV